MQKKEAAVRLGSLLGAIGREVGVRFFNPWEDV
ncbi:hypothetical protein EDC20_13213 [Gluconobacter oxydans]|nr:hypothetical protein EDC20_13213 [Gluconobacter oxydans]